MQKKHLLVFLLLVFSQLDSSAISLLVSIPIIICYIVTKKEIVKFNELYILSFIGLIAAVMGLVAATYSTHSNAYFYIKDLSFFIQAPVYCYVGYTICKYRNSDYDELVKTLVLSITTVSVINLSKIPFHIPELAQIGVSSREEFHFHNVFSFLSLMIVYYYRLSGLNLFGVNKDRVLLFISALSIFLSFSRTATLIAIVILILPYIQRANMTSKIMLLIMFFTLVNIFAGSLLDIKVSKLDNITFYDKLMHSFSEVIVREIDDRRGINDNWRGYEAFMGVDKYLSGNALELVFGQGLGSYVKTPFWVFNGEVLSIIPMFHNGFITILLKAGIFGLLVFMFFLYRMSRFVINSLDRVLYPVMMSKVGLAYVIALTTFVTHGLFTKQAPFIILFYLGMVSCYLNENNEVKYEYKHKIGSS